MSTANGYRLFARLEAIAKLAAGGRATDVRRRHQRIRLRRGRIPTKPPARWSASRRANRTFGLRVEQTLANGSTPARTVFGLRKNPVLVGASKARCAGRYRSPTSQPWRSGTRAVLDIGQFLADRHGDLAGRRIDVAHREILALQLPDRVITAAVPQANTFADLAEATPSFHLIDGHLCAPPPAGRGRGPVAGCFRG